MNCDMYSLMDRDALSQWILSVERQGALTIARDLITLAKSNISLTKKIESHNGERVRHLEMLGEARAKSSMDKSIGELELSVRAYNCLGFLDVKTLGDATQKTINDLRAARNCGQKTINVIRDQLGKHGLALSGDAIQVPREPDLDDLESDLDYLDSDLDDNSNPQDIPLSSFPNEINCFGLSSLAKAGFIKLGDVSKLTAEQLHVACLGCGNATLRDVRGVLFDHGLCFAGEDMDDNMDIDAL